jgi:hypothetical protein
MWASDEFLMSRRFVAAGVLLALILSVPVALPAGATSVPQTDASTTSSCTPSVVDGAIPDLLT